MTIPFNASAPAPVGGHILGQPFTLSAVNIPINGKIACNCTQPPSEMTIVASAPVKCPVCEKTYVVAINPANGQILVAISVEEQKVPS